MTSLRNAPPNDSDMDDFIAEGRTLLLTRIRSTSPKRRRSWRRDVAIGFASVLVIGTGAAVASPGGFADFRGSDQPSYHGPRGTTEDGRSYGSSLDPDGRQLDLVAVVGDHGKAGFVDRAELEGWEPSKLCETQRLPVYATDGETQLDTFTSGGRADSQVNGFRVTSRSSPTCPHD